MGILGVQTLAQSGLGRSKVGRWAQLPRLACGGQAGQRKVIVAATTTTRAGHYSHVIFLRACKLIMGLIVGSEDMDMEGRESSQVWLLGRCWPSTTSTLTDHPIYDDGMESRK